MHPFSLFVQACSSSRPGTYSEGCVAETTQTIRKTDETQRCKGPPMRLKKLCLCIHHDRAITSSRRCKKNQLRMPAAVRFNLSEAHRTRSTQIGCALDLGIVLRRAGQLIRLICLLAPEFSHPCERAWWLCAPSARLADCSFAIRINE